MDRTKKEHRSFFFPGQEVQWRAPQATQDAEGDHFQVQPRRRDVQTTDMSVSRAVSLSQPSSSQIMSNNFYSSPANDPVPGVVYPQMQDVSAPAYRFHDDTGYYDQNLYPGAYHDGSNFLPAQPQVDHNASQMDIVPSGNGGFPANSWPQHYEALRDRRPLAAYVADLYANATSELLNIPEGVSWNPDYSELVLQGDQRQGSAVPPLQRVSGDLYSHEVPTHFVLGFEQGHFHTVGIQNEPGSWPATSKLVSSYPVMGYEKVFDNHRHAANSRVTGVAAELEDPINRQHKPMLNYRRMPSTSLLPLPSPSSPHAEPNQVANRAAFETSSDVSLESQQNVWDVVTGKSVPVKRKRSPSNEERADSQAIRNSGGQCKRCKDGKRKQCKVSHLRPGSEASTASPSARTCSDSETSFVQATTNNKRRKTTFLEPPPEAYSQSTRHLLGSVPGLPAVPETSSDIPSLDATASAESHANSVSDSGTIVPDVVDWGDINFSQDNLCSGEQFSGASGTSPQAHH